MKHKPTIEDSNSKKGPDLAGKIFEEVANEAIIMTGFGLCVLWRIFKKHPIFTSLGTGALYYSSQKFVLNRYYLIALNEMAPEFFTIERLQKWFFQYFTDLTLTNSFFTIFLIAILIVFGMYQRLEQSKYEKIFVKIGLKNGEGKTPVLVSKKKINEVKDEFIFDSKFISKSEFINKKEHLEGAFEKRIQSIEYGKTQKFIKLTFNTGSLPETVTLSEILNREKLRECEFIVGQAETGIIKQKLSDLPHLLIAGTTGGGKSTFFKQAILSLLKTTPHIQLAIFDLKRGLEAADFKSAPNVVIAKTTKESVVLLASIIKKMEDRFDYLEKIGKKEIVPARDKMERIVIAIDECSVLLGKRDRSDETSSAALQARSYVDQIAKLGRAAAINLIVATQKIEKDTLPTAVQENINGKMVFKANTLNGSLIPLGSKDALDLPDIPGRAIWKVGNLQETVQAPYLSEEDIRGAIAQIADEFENGTRKLFEPLLNSTQDTDDEVAKGKNEILIQEADDEESASLH